MSEIMSELTYPNFPMISSERPEDKQTEKVHALINRKCVIPALHVRPRRDDLVVSLKVVCSRLGRVRPKTIIKSLDCHLTWHAGVLSCN